MLLLLDYQYIYIYITAEDSENTCTELFGLSIAFGVDMLCSNKTKPLQIESILRVPC